MSCSCNQAVGMDKSEIPDLKQVTQPFSCCHDCIRYYFVLYLVVCTHAPAAYTVFCNFFVSLELTMAGSVVAPS